MNAPTALKKDSVVVQAPARLHLGFVDLDRPSGRRFGSIGLTIDELATRVIATPAENLSVVGDQAGRASEHLEKLHRRLGLCEGVHLRVEQTIPSHAGLGSGTQLALAIGAAVSQLAGFSVTPSKIARWLDRGVRSGIGVGAFLHGGFLVDGGHSKQGVTPPITARVDFPENWRVLLIFDRSRQGLHGRHELTAFQALPAFAESLSAHLCRLVLTRMLPGLVEGDLDEFGAALSEIQRSVGDHFASAQGARFASEQVARVLEWLEAQGVACVGQSSWGPTGFAIVASEGEADVLRAMAMERWPRGSDLDFMITRGRNRGADIEIFAHEQTSGA